MLKRYLHVLLLCGGVGWLLVASFANGTNEIRVGAVPVLAEQGISDHAGRDGWKRSEYDFDDEELRFIELFERVSPSVVHVHTNRPRPELSTRLFNRRDARLRALAAFRGRVSDPKGGSGMIYDEAGHILTTNRVVAGAQEIEVTFADGTEAVATVIGADRNTDLAVLAVDKLPDSVRPLLFDDSDSLMVGQRVLVLGNPLGHVTTMTTGVVSATARNVRLELRTEAGVFTAPDLIQTDAAITAGMVGGPLVNLDGKVVGVAGVDTLLFDAVGDTAAGGVAFSIPTSTVERVVPVLLEKGRYPYPWLGLSAPRGILDPDWARAMGLPPGQQGVLVIRVTPGGPAAKAGLRGGEQPSAGLDLGVLIGGDVITAFNGHPVKTFSELVSRLFREGQVGDTITLTIVRRGEVLEVPVLLEERP